MFDRLRGALEDVLARLESRSGADIGEEVDRLLYAMREELVEARARIPELEAHMRTLERQREAEQSRAEVCVRRASQADAIGDAETVEVAERFARQHLARAEVLKQKIEAARAELDLGRAEVEEMTARLKEAIGRRSALEVQARRTRSVETAHGAGREALEEFERLAERMARPVDLESARRELDRERDLGPGPAPADPELSRLAKEARAEELLRELKRRMEREGEG